MTTNSSLNLKLKNSVDIDYAINTMTKNIQDTIQMSTITHLVQENPNKNITSEIKELILLKRRARNTWQRTHYPIDKQRYNYYINRLKSTPKKHKIHLFTTHLQSLSPSNGSLWKKNKSLLKHKTVNPLLFATKITISLPFLKKNQNF
jgi:hypothetical protein